MKEIIRPKNMYKQSSGRYAIKAGNTIYTSGVVSYDLEGNCFGRGDFLAQLDKCFDNLKKILEASGATMADIVQLNIFVTDIEFFHIDGLGELWAKYLAPAFPPNAGLQVAGLTGEFLVELSAIAVIDG